MTLLRLTGADLSGSSGDTGRTYTIGSGTLVESSFKAWVSGVFLHDSDFSISGNIITLNNFIYNDQPITFEYNTEESDSSSSSLFGYVTVQSVYNTAGIDSTVISETQIRQFITAAEQEVDNDTFTTYWSQQATGQANSSTDNTLTVTGSPYSENEYLNNYVWIYQGTGSDQVRKITENDANTLTVDRDWETNPDNTSKFRIIHTASDPYISEAEDGDGSQQKLLNSYPLVLLEALTINSTSVSPTNVFQYKKVGKLQLGPSSEYKYFASTPPQAVDISYWFGVYPIPTLVQEYVRLSAAERALASQMGGTYNVPSTYSLPEGSVTIGQAYVNIDGTAKRINALRRDIAKQLVKYPAVF